jgi:hypothetical protein
MRASGVSPSVVVLAFAPVFFAPGLAHADGPDAPPAASAATPPLRREEPFATKPGYAQLFATVMGGTGLRFNNPYRLSTPLGSDAQSVSRTAGYVDLGLAVTLGHPLGFQHGFALRSTVAVEGVGQAVFTPSYFGWRRRGTIAGYLRAGVPIVATPDLTWGLEGALGGVFFLLGGFGIVAELVGDVFYGQGTREASVVTYPVLSGQLGFLGSLEVLP